MARSNTTSGEILFADSANMDAFSRLKVATPTALFSGQFTYDLQPLVYEPITAQSGATITHNTTNRNALMTFSSTPTGGKAYLQTYQYFRYEPGKSQELAITFNMIQGVANTLKFAGLSDSPVGYEFSQEGTVTASSGARTHLLSIRPKTTFNSIVNRVGIAFLEVDVLVTGTNPVLWELCLGQAISGTTTYNDVNTTYSATEYNTAGTISGSPTIVIDSGYVAATNQARGNNVMTLTFKYPITLDAAGAVRALGTLSLLVTGIGGTSACRGSLKWSEVR